MIIRIVHKARRADRAQAGCGVNVVNGTPVWA